jgi:hypothetical protein
MIGGVVIPYVWFTPPEYGMGLTYWRVGKSMESYQDQLRDAGFIVDYGSFGIGGSLWIYERVSDGVIFAVRLFGEGTDEFNMSMY